MSEITKNENQKALDELALEKVSGAGGDMYYHLQYLVCPRCGLQVGWDEFSPHGSNTYYRWNGEGAHSLTLYCNGCGHTVGAGYFAGEKD